MRGGTKTGAHAPEWQVLSPDGLPIWGEPGGWSSEAEARIELFRWAQRYYEQGYYRTGSGERIDYGQLPARCIVRQIGGF